MSALAGWLRDHGPVTVLTGAGLSTESGIPDYRGPTGSLRKHTPMTWQSFTRDADARQRYWARSHLGWQVMSDAMPNAGHRAVAGLQADGLLGTVITQNVDGLHSVAALESAGAVDVIELHGSIHRVTCLLCSEVTTRLELQRRLTEANPGWTAQVTDVLADGDVMIPEAAVASFRVVSCECGGLLKPDVVFFGETVPPDRVANSFAAVESARGLLVLGSSLSVMSGYRFVLRAAKLGISVAIVNQGATRGDERASLLVDAPLGETLSDLRESVLRESDLLAGASAVSVR